ncbi:MAG: hypothetical protein WCB67_07165 [Solirubrobacteraceae bacterium]
MSRLCVVVLVTCTFGLLCALAAAGFIVVREWCWNRDRKRRVVMMLHEERALDEATAFLAHPKSSQLAAQLEEIRALPEVLKPVGH